MERDSQNCKESTGPVQLLMIQIVNIEDLHPAFLQYDTEGLYPLPTKGKYILLLFKKSRDSNLFTTLRRYTPRKHIYYSAHLGERFDIEII
jgi:hypothetical protein